MVRRAKTTSVPMTPPIMLVRMRERSFGRDIGMFFVRWIVYQVRADSLCLVFGF